MLKSTKSEMKAREDLRSHSPFEALLAVSVSLDAAETSRSSGKPRISRTQYRTDCSQAEQSEPDSADNTAMGEAYAEGIATSGGGESGDTDFQSESSREMQVSDSTKAEMSESRASGRGAESSRSRSAAKKQRMVWTIELHKRFLNAVNHLGMDNAVPKVILKMMNVDGMTRENVASHLQKYRLHLKHQTDNQKDRPETDMFMHALESPASRKISSRPRAEPSQAARGLPLSLTAPTPHAVPPVTGGGTAIGLPLSSRLSPYQVAGSLLIGRPCEHIPPQAWAAGVPGYDALQKLNRIPEKQKAALLRDLTAPRPLSEGLHQPRSLQSQHLPILSIAPLSTTPAVSATSPAAKGDPARQQGDRQPVMGGPQAI